MFNTHRWNTCFHCITRLLSYLFRTAAALCVTREIRLAYLHWISTCGFMNGAHDVSWGHDDVIKWKHFPRNWPFVREIHRSPVNFPHKGQWRGALMFSLIYAWINDWVNNHEAGDLRRQHGHYDVIVMCLQSCFKIKFCRYWIMIKLNTAKRRYVVYMNVGYSRRCQYDL